MSEGVGRRREKVIGKGGEKSCLYFHYITARGGGRKGGGGSVKNKGEVDVSK